VRLEGGAAFTGPALVAQAATPTKQLKSKENIKTLRYLLFISKFSRNWFYLFDNYQ
jgi:hypothetical protein